MIEQLSHLHQEGLEALVNSINGNIEYYDNVIYTNEVFRDLIHLSEEDISRLSPADIEQKDNIITELMQIAYVDGDYDNLEQTMEYYQQDAINLIDKATRGEGVKY